MGQQQPAAKQPPQWIKPLPGWYGTSIHAKGRVSVYSEASHAIYSVAFSPEMSVKELKISVCRLLHRPPTMSIRLYLGDKVLGDGDSLEVLTPESLLRLELLSEDSTSDTFVSDGDASRRQATSPAPKFSASLDSSQAAYFAKRPLRYDLSDLAVPDLELKGSAKIKRKK